MNDNNIKNLALEWCVTENPDIPRKNYCASRDVFLARLDNLAVDMRANGKMNEGEIFMLTAIAGEIGNNSFDHNLGNWPDVPGIFFDWQIGDRIEIVLADRGQGIAKTLGKVKSEIADDKTALQVAFFEKISGRAPESRGNGLKFVRQGIKSLNAHLTVTSGNAQAGLNQDFVIVTANQNIRGCLAVIEAKNYEN